MGVYNEVMQKLALCHYKKHEYNQMLKLLKRNGYVNTHLYKHIKKLKNLTMDWE
jgi:hypothetical protein